MVKYWLPITANLLTMPVYILEGQNFHILISNNDLTVVTNALYLLPMFCQYFADVKYLFLPIVSIMIGKIF